MLKTIPHVAVETCFALKGGQPKWTSIGIEDFPAVPWKVANIRKMSAKKQSELLEKLMRVLKF